MNYGIWLSFNNQEEGFQIPINPERINIGDGGKGRTYDIDKLGEINVIKNPKLTEYSFESIFPAKHYPFVAASILLEPRQYVELILKWMGTKRPIRFVFVGKSFEINEAVSIEDFQWHESADNDGDIEYTLRLKKYVFYAAKQVTVTEQPNQTPQIIKEKPQRPDDRIPPKEYRMVAGDTLWSIAKRTLGDGSRWREIQQLNGISDAEVKRLPVGKVLKLPTNGVV